MSNQAKMSSKDYDLLRQQMKDHLDEVESAPGALCFVLNHVRTLSDDEVAQIYERSEGQNDADRDATIDGMTSDQLDSMLRSMYEIAGVDTAELD